MGNNKESKKGFWSTLFAPQKKNCCNGNIIVDDEIKPVSPSCCAHGPADAHETTSSDTAGGVKAREVLVLGPGCVKCRETFRIVERVIAENNIDVKLSKIEDIAEMISYNIMTTPAVVVDGTVKIKGHVPTPDEVKKAIGF